jgi:hypothetical protein
MKRAVSVSLGSSARDKKVVISLKGEQIVAERIGTDGDAQKARRLFAELDGKVDALGVGGVDLYLRLNCNYLRADRGPYLKNRTGGIPMPLMPTHRDASVTFFGQ